MPDSCLTDLACTACAASCFADEPRGVCPSCGKVLFARYDFGELRQVMPKPDLAGRPWDLWRYRELLPVRDQRHAISLGEGATPLVPFSTTALAAAGMPRAEIIVKDEGANPTGSFKARGLSVAVARAAELGIRDVALPSAGNAGAAAAAFAAAHGIGCHVAMPKDAPAATQAEVALYGAELLLVEGLIDAAGHSSASGPPRMAGSTSPRSRSPTALRARRRWASSWPSRVAGEMPGARM